MTITMLVLQYGTDVAELHPGNKKLEWGKMNIQHETKSTEREIFNFQVNDEVWNEYPISNTE